MTVLRELKNGEQLFGQIASETAASITMKLPDSTSRPVLRADIDRLRSAGLSLMPEGLESVITKQEMADLIALLRKKG